MLASPLKQLEKDVVSEDLIITQENEVVVNAANATTSNQDSVASIMNAYLDTNTTLVNQQSEPDHSFQSISSSSSINKEEEEVVVEENTSIDIAIEQSESNVTNDVAVVEDN